MGTTLDQGRSNGTSATSSTVENGGADGPWISYQSQQAHHHQQLGSSDTQSLAGTEVSSPLSPAEDTSSNRVTAKLVGRLLLFGVSFLYGTMNVVFRYVYDLPGPPSASALSSARGWMAAACFIPFLLAKPRSPASHTPQRHQPLSQHDSDADLNDAVDASATRSRDQASDRRPSFWRTALELALWNFGSQGLVNVGLLWTESARASFLTQTSVVMTPVVSALAGHPVRRTVWAACGCAMGGLILLSSRGGKMGAGFGVGDILCLAGALCWSMYIFRLSSVGDLFDEVNLQAAKTLNLAILYTSWFLLAAARSDVSLWPGWTSPLAWALLFYTAAGPGTLADVLQQKGQAIIPASESNVILSMEPVFTSFLGFIILGEDSTVTEKFGGGLIILAAIIATR